MGLVALMALYVYIIFGYDATASFVGQLVPVGVLLCYATTGWLYILSLGDFVYLVSCYDLKIKILVNLSKYYSASTANCFYT